MLKVRINNNVDQFLVKPLGLALHEVTGSSLVKIDANGKLILFQNSVQLCSFIFRRNTGSRQHNIWC